MRDNKYDAVIICTTTSIDYSYLSEYFVGVEKGCLDILNRNLPLGLAVGDFDHVTLADITLINKSAQKVIKFSSAKDYLDGECAIQEVLKRNKKNILFIAEGKEIDFMFSIMAFVHKYNISVRNEKSYAEPLQKGVNILCPPVGMNYFSLIPIQKSVVNITGFYYEARELSLETLSTRALRNTFNNLDQKQPLQIEIISGAAIAVWGK